jgi:Right handed beta helix region
MSVRRLMLLAPFLAAALAVPAHAADYYMATNGSDANPCTLVAPCRTVDRASGRLAAGDTLYIRGGTYRTSSFPDGYEDWHLPAGSPGRPTTIRAYPGETPVFDGGMTQGEFMIPNTRYLLLDGLTVQHFDNSSGNGAITPCGSMSHLEIRNMTFRDNGSRTDNDHDIYTCGGRVSWVYIHRNRFIRGPGGALHMWHYPQAQHVFFYDNVVRDKYVGVYACDGAGDVRITNNTFVNTTGATRGTIVTSCGERVNGPRDIYVRNNIFYRTAGVQWQRGGERGRLVEDHNVWYGGILGFAPSTTDTRSNPLFVSVGANDFDLQTGSPAIDAGTAIDAPAEDFVGSARPQGGRLDIGAYEAGGAPREPPAPRKRRSRSSRARLRATVLRPRADTYIDQGAPTANYHDAPLLLAYGDGGTNRCYGGCARALLDFARVPARARTVKLRVHASAPSSEPVQVWSIEQGCRWSDDTVTWNTRPDQDVVVATLTRVKAGWNEIALPVATLATPQRAGESGHACFYVTTPGTGHVRFDNRSRRSSPRLVVEK